MSEGQSGICVRIDDDMPIDFLEVPAFETRYGSTLVDISWRVLKKLMRCTNVSDNAAVVLEAAQPEFLPARLRGVSTLQCTIFDFRCRTSGYEHQAKEADLHHERAHSILQLDNNMHPAVRWLTALQSGNLWSVQESRMAINVCSDAMSCIGLQHCTQDALVW